MGLSHSPSIVTENLEFYIDPSNTRSYPGFGNTIYNIVNTSIGCTFVNFTTNPIDNAGNRSIFFDGSNNSVFIPSSNLQFASSDFTIQFWVKIQGIIDQKVIFGDGWQATNGGFLFYTYKLGSNERVTYYSTSTSGTWDIADAKDIIVSPSYNTWYNIAVSRVGNVFTLYSNGQAVNTFTSSLSLRNTGYPYALCASPTAANASKCSIGSVFIYRNKGLSAAEISQNYHATKKKYLIEENIVTNGLVLNLDPGNPNSYSGSGNTVYDLSGSGINGALINNPSFSGLNGGQINMPGSSKYIDIGQNFNFTSQNFSISYWVYLDSFTTNQAGQGPIPFFKGDYQQMGYYSQIDSNGSFGFATNQGGAIQTSSTLAGIITTSTWYHLSYVRNGTSVRLYSNGVDSTSAVASHNNPGSSNQTFKINYYKPDYLITSQMRISQFLIYNRALSATEIQQNYNATKGRFLNALPPVRNGLVLELDAANTSSYSGFGNTWYDLTGNGYNYTLTNGPVFSSFGTTQNFFFDGSNDRALAVNPISLGTTHTVSMIIKPSSSSEDGILFGDYGHDNTGYAMYVNGGSSIFYSTTNYTNIPITLSTNWIMLTITRIGTSIFLYQNGSLIGSNSLGGNNPLTLSSIADYNGGGFPFGGSISQVSCYNRALSAYEIKQNFDFYRTRYGI